MIKNPAGFGQGSRPRVGGGGRSRLKAQGEAEEVGFHIGIRQVLHRQLLFVYQKGSKSEAQTHWYSMRESARGLTGGMPEASQPKRFLSPQSAW